jgi:IS1 family transposase
MANNLATEQKAMAISLLAEGSSIRSIERVTGIHRDTIMRLGVRVGESCARIHDEKMRELNCNSIEVDEIWGFVGKKRKNLKPFEQIDHGYGDAWTYVALDPETKLAPAFLTSSVRSVNATKAFIDDLSGRLANRVQISSDGLQAYIEAIEQGFGAKNVDYAQVVKTYSVCNLNKDAASRYSPADVVKVEKEIVFGEPDEELISTSHVEKQNHTLRMHCRRLSRLTNAFSKKVENFKAAVALNFAYYNFCKKHIAVKATPAQAAGVEAHQWTVAELIERCGE